MRFFKSLLEVKTVWVETGSGQWARKRRLHPILNILFWGGVLTIVGLVGSSFLNRSSSENPDEPVQVANMPDSGTSSVPDEMGTEPESLDSDLPDGLIKVTVLPAALDGSPSATSVASISITDAILTSPMDATEVTATDATGLVLQEKNLNPGVKVQELPEPKNQTPVQLPKPKPQTVAPANLRDYWISIDKSDYTLTLFKGEQAIREYSIAVGRNPGDKQYIGDNRTPEGDFRIVSIENASSWTHDFGDGKGKIHGAYGPWFFRLDAKGWKGIGIHGTHDPDSRGTMATEGCIRVENSELQDLKRYAYRNMRVVINP